MVATGDGGFLLIGNTTSYGVGNDDAWVVKIDSLGRFEWSRVLGGASNDWGYDGVEVNGGYIICGNTESYGLGGQDFVAFRLDYEGDLVWTQCYGGLGNEYARFVTLLEDSTVQLTGYTSSSTFGANDILFVRIDPSYGNQVLCRHYGGDYNEFPHNIVGLPGSEVVQVGYRRNYPGITWRGYWAVHDSSGQLYRQMEYGIDNEKIQFNDVIPNDRGGFVICGFTENPNSSANFRQVVVTEIDSLGNVAWTRQYGGPGEDMANAIEAHPTGGYLLSGPTTSFSSGYDAFLMHIDTSGNLIWQRNFGGSGVEAPAWNDPVLTISSGGLAFFLNSSTKGVGGGDFVFSRLDNSGNISGCSPDSTRFVGNNAQLREYPIAMQTATSNYGLGINPYNSFVTPDTQISCCPVPVADFTTLSGCTDIPVTFTNNSTGALPGAGFFWDFDGDGNVDATGETPAPFTFTTPGNYFATLEVRNVCGSIAYDTLQLSILQGLSFDLGPDQELCEGDSLVLGGNLPAGNRIWNNGAPADSLKINTGGLYWVEITNPFGCTYLDSVYISKIPRIDFDLGADTTFCDIHEWKMRVKLPHADLLWSTGEKGNVLIANESGVYSLTAQNSCFSKSDTVRLAFEGNQTGPFIPTAFSPNGDGLNDRLEVVGSELKSFEIQIFDRWGRMIYMGNQMNAWDGKVNGIDAPEGVYVWRISYIGCDGNRKRLKGSITLLR